MNRMVWAAVVLLGLLVSLVAGSILMVSAQRSPGQTASQVLRATASYPPLLYGWPKTWGGSSDDSSGVALDQWGNLYTSGGFATTVDFDPGSGTDSRTSNGGSDAFVSRFMPLSNPVYLPLIAK